MLPNPENSVTTIAEIEFRAIYPRPNRKYFGALRGLTWLNMINDQGPVSAPRSSPAPSVIPCT
jgi:hypothetical protein